MLQWQQNYGSAMQELLSFTLHIISRKISEISWNMQWPITRYKSNYVHQHWKNICYHTPSNA